MIVWSMMRASLFDTDGPDLLDVRDTLKHFFDAVLLQCAHTLLERGHEHLCDPGPFLHERLDTIRSDEQLVERDAALVTGFGADVATLRVIQRDLSGRSAELFFPLGPQLFALALR